MVSLKNSLVSAVLVWLLLGRFVGINCADCPGCVELDELSFDNLIQRFPYAFIKFDRAFPYGDKHEAFASLSRLLNENSQDLLMGLVSIKNYGEHQNEKLAERFGIKEENYPIAILFRRESADHIFFPANTDFNLESLIKFLQVNTVDLYIGCAGCLKEFDHLVQHFMDLDEDERNARLDKALKISAVATNDVRVKRSADIYILYMKRFCATAQSSAIDSEIQRLTRISNERISEEKKAEFQLKLNIIRSFRTKSEDKDEL